MPLGAKQNLKTIRKTAATSSEVLDSIKEAIQGHTATLREFNEPVPAPRSFASTVRAA